MSEMHSKRKTEEVVRRDDGEKEENCGRLTAVSKIGVDIRAPGLFLQSSTILRQSITLENVYSFPVGSPSLLSC